MQKVKAGHVLLLSISTVSVRPYLPLTTVFIFIFGTVYSIM